MPVKKTRRGSKRTKKTKADIVFTETAVVITLDATARRQALNCLRRSGKITFAVKEHTITRLPQLLENGKLID